MELYEFEGNKNEEFPALSTLELQANEKSNTYIFILYTELKILVSKNYSENFMNRLV